MIICKYHTKMGKEKKKKKVKWREGKGKTCEWST